MSSAAPARITPFYEVPKDLEDSELLSPEAAELQQGGKTFTGTVLVIQQWAPLMAYVEFITPSPSEIEFGDAHIKSTNIDIDISVAVIMSNGVRGVPSGNLEIGSDHKLDRATFHLPNCPGLFGGQDYQETITDGQKTTSL